MTGFDGNGTQGNPPSFIPSSGRHRPAPQSPRLDQPSADPSAQPANAGAGAPPSFPSTTGRHAASAPTYPPSNAPSGTPSMAPSIAPSQSFQPQSFQPQSQSAPQSAPQSIPPRRAPRRSAGSSRNASVSPASAASRMLSGTGPTGSAASAAPAGSWHGGALPGTAQPGAPLQGSGAAPVAVRRRRRALPIVLCTLALLVALLVAAVFGALGWVNGRLNKSDWLTGKADTSGATSWLILGSDERDGSSAPGAGDDTVTGYRTDTILVLTKPKSGPSSLISIPRDSLVQLDGQYMKINAVAQLYGGKQLVGQVEQITGQKIDHVAQIKFGGLESVVDALGGITLCYDQTVNDPQSGLNWKAGCHEADGATALAFSRMRYSDAQGDFGRAARQRQVIGAIMKKALSAGTLANPAVVTATADATLKAITVDNDTNASMLLSMGLAFRDATGDNGISGSLYWTDPGYYVEGVGSSVLLDDTKNLALFSQLAEGTHKAGSVGTLAES